MGRRKAFIDRNKATTYRLVHRSQRDPLIADNDAGQHVLQKISKNEVEERTKYGIYYTDEYDYLKHLKAVGEAVDLGGEEVERAVVSVPKKNLPSVIFETKGVELKVGLLNQAAPRNELLPDIDPDIAAALEGDFNEDDEDNLLEDDFVLKANAAGDDGSVMPLERVSQTVNRSEMLERFGLVREERFSDESSDDDYEGEGGNNNGASRSNADCFNDEKEERRSRFTNYSMSSAVIKRPDGLQIIDEHFEALYAQYDDERCGQIDEEVEVIAGHMDPEDERFKQFVEEYSSVKRKFIPERPPAEVKEKVLKIVDSMGLVDDEELVETDEEDDDEYGKKPRWDCESILSTLSNKRNHPVVIRDECASVKANRRKVRQRQALPLGEADEEEDERMDDTESAISAVSTIRAKGETPEERRARKQAVREQRRERRVEKKMTKLAFRDQKKEFDRQRSTVRVNVRPIN